MVYTVTIAFIALDFLTGMIYAIAEKNFSSTKMREGLFHKSGLILCVALATLIDYAQAYLDLGVSVPVTMAVCSYICLMEIASIIENVCKINPDIMPDKLIGLFGIKKGGKNE